LAQGYIVAVAGVVAFNRKYLTR